MTEQDKPERNDAAWRAAEKIDMEYYTRFFGQHPTHGGTGYLGRCDWLAEVIRAELSASGGEVVR